METHFRRVLRTFWKRFYFVASHRIIEMSIGVKKLLDTIGNLGNFLFIYYFKLTNEPVN